MCIMRTKTKNIFLWKLSAPANTEIPLYLISDIFKSTNLMFLGHVTPLWDFLPYATEKWHYDKHHFQGRTLDTPWRTQHVHLSGIVANGVESISMQDPIPRYILRGCFMRSLGSMKFSMRSWRHIQTGSINNVLFSSHCPWTGLSNSPQCSNN